ncbi:hypothetical protein EL22_25515 [Halostagnicola sp. A56]|uniref:MEDS domain-containing protein n=1 Tax=Halostagnicola sp. A56 TaxID=1495067 RepID=UPI0004A02FC5|nr:MEDS domain-containing protein [Halostagnicola sp. A56]KDE56663.1 hypothetical protein EL22_25515 [Halostagnicola sp. A56]
MNITENNLFGTTETYSVDFDRICHQSNLVAALDTTNLAVLFETREERVGATMPFVKSGLKQNQRCLYLAAERSSEELRSTLTRFDVDHESVPDEQLVVTQLTERQETDVALDFDDVLDFIFEMVDESLDLGFDGLLITAEMSWIHSSDITIGDLLKATSRFNQTATDLPCVALGQYDMTEFDASDLIDILHAYSDIVYRGKLCPNSYYTRPEIFLEREKPDIKFERMLQTLSDLSSAYDDIQRRQQRLDVLSRIMRHNIRNDLNLILGQSTALSETLETEELADCAEQIQTTARELLTIADNANQLNTSLDHESTTILPIPLSRTVNRVVDDIRRANPEISISTHIADNLWVSANDDFEFAVQTLVQTVIEYSTSVTLSAEKPQSNSAPSITLELTVAGEQFPQSEFAAVSDGKETPLNHGNGIGLWIVHWIVDQSGGDLSITSNDEETIFSISLPTVLESGPTGF